MRRASQLMILFKWKILSKSKTNFLFSSLIYAHDISMTPFKWEKGSFSHKLEGQQRIRIPLVNFTKRYISWPKTLFTARLIILLTNLSFKFEIQFSSSGIRWKVIDLTKMETRVIYVKIWKMHIQLKVATCTYSEIKMLILSVRPYEKPFWRPKPGYPVKYIKSISIITEIN